MMNPVITIGKKNKKMNKTNKAVPCAPIYSKELGEDNQTKQIRKHPILDGLALGEEPMEEMHGCT
jgi:hypothetical protein